MLKKKNQTKVIRGREKTCDGKLKIKKKKHTHTHTLPNHIDPK